MTATDRLAPAPRVALVDRNTTGISIRYRPQIATIQSRILENTIIEKL